jgi:hypothetical protein
MKQRICLHHFLHVLTYMKMEKLVVSLSNTEGIQKSLRGLVRRQALFMTALKQLKFLSSITMH